MKCHWCNGTGRTPEDPHLSCPDCEGGGVTFCRECGHFTPGCACEEDPPCADEDDLYWIKEDDND